MPAEVQNQVKGLAEDAEREQKSGIRNRAGQAMESLSSKFGTQTAMTSGVGQLQSNNTAGASSQARSKSGADEGAGNNDIDFGGSQDMLEDEKEGAKGGIKSGDGKGNK